MIELVVSVSLMVLLLGVLAFVFRQSAEAVASSTEAVNTVQRARSFEGRFDQDISRAVRSVVETGTGRMARTFLLLDRSTMDSADPYSIDPSGGDEVMFISKTRYRGIEAMWVVRYYYEAAVAGAEYGAIKRMVRVDDAAEEIRPYDVDDAAVWDLRAAAGERYDPTVDDAMEVETIVSPVSPILGEPVFHAIDPDASLVDANLEFRLPASVKVSINFLDSRATERFVLPMQFNFPIYQGE
jgi:hypothetical protein